VKDVEFYTYTTPRSAAITERKKTKSYRSCDNVAIDFSPETFSGGADGAAGVDGAV
jgi:hypothetical protein